MTDRKAVGDDETPEDVATLYSWANLHGAKYRDFSASRAQTRERARQRVQEAMEAERQHARDGAEAERNIDAERAAEAARIAEAERRAARAAEENAWRAEQIAAAQQRVRMETAMPANGSHPQQSGYPAAGPISAQVGRETAYQSPGQSVNQSPREASYPVPAPVPVQAVSQVTREASYPPPSHAVNPIPREAAYVPQQMPIVQQAPFASQEPAAYVSAPQRPMPQAPVAPQQYAPRPVAVPPPGPASYVPLREEVQDQPADGWAAPDTRDASVRPAWLSAERAEPPAAAQVPPAPEDTLQASRDRLTSRWFALKGVFAGAPVQVEPAPVPVTSRAPIVAVFSLAGGVGKTSIVATLGRALSARGERVLLVDTAAYGLLPFFFGARDQRPGVLRTFSPPGGSGDAPVQMVTIDVDSLAPETASQEPLSQEIQMHGRLAGRILVDLATASGTITRRVLRMSPTVLVPMMADMSSVVSVSAIDAFFERHGNGAGHKVTPYYILNQFDASLPLHLDVREVLREQLGERLLPFALRRTPAVSEALAEGMTVVDYAPNSTATEDFGGLASWIKNLAAPATQGYRGVRWSER